jgi:hypothetical protein
MSWMAMYIISCIAGAIMMAYFTWDEQRKAEYFRVTLQDLFIAIALVFIPLINTMVAFVLMCYFIGEHSKNIVLFGKKE